MKAIPFVRYSYLLLIFFIFCACEDSLPDYYVDIEFTLTDFNGVKLGDAFQIEIVKAEEFKVIAKGEEGDLNDLILTVEANVLTGRYRQGSRNHKRTLIEIHVPQLQEVEVHSATTTRIWGFDAAENNLNLQVSGASEAYFTGKSRNLTVSIDGASFLSLSGEAENLSADVRGASQLRAKSLKATAAHLQVHSRSHANVEVVTALTGGVHSGSSLIYFGNPEIMDVSVATGFSVQHGL